MIILLPTYYTWPVVDPVGRQADRGTEGREDPSAEEGLRVSTSSDRPGALSKLAGNNETDIRGTFWNR